MSPYSASTRVRGIRVAVITRRSARRPWQRGRAAGAREAVLLVDHGERQIGEADIILEQRVRPDGDRALRPCARSARTRARAAALAPGESAGAKPVGASSAVSVP